MENENVVLLGVGSIIALIIGIIVVYIKHMKEKIKGFVLRHKKIEKYLKD